MDRKDEPRLFIIGYFDVEKVYDFSKIQNADYHSVFEKVPNNAHSKIYFRLKELGVKYSDVDLVIVKGKSSGSKLLTKALLLGDPDNKMLKGFESIFGYKGSLQRAVGHWIKNEYIHKVKKWLENEGL